MLSRKLLRFNPLARWREEIGAASPATVVKDAVLFSRVFLFDNMPQQTVFGSQLAGQSAAVTCQPLPRVASEGPSSSLKPFNGSAYASVHPHHQSGLPLLHPGIGPIGLTPPPLLRKHCLV